MNSDQLFSKLWKQYTELAPSARKVHQLFEEKGEEVLNDHIAFRTFNHPKVNIEVLAKPFLALGYEMKGEYDFPAKKLYARHFEHATDNNAPKIFISELKLEECSQLVQETAARLVNEISEEQLQYPALCTAGRLWK